ncbi:hypothetical protein EB093_06350 [bacterium]|nr:hypothetical protein [bacterium]
MSYPRVYIGVFLIGLGIVSQSIDAQTKSGASVTTRFVIHSAVTTASIRQFRALKSRGVISYSPQIPTSTIQVTYNPKLLIPTDIVDAFRNGGTVVSVASQNQLKVSNFVIRSF